MSTLVENDEKATTATTTTTTTPAATTTTTTTTNISSWDDKPIITKYTKKLLGIVEPTNEKESSTLSDTSSIVIKNVEPKSSRVKNNNSPAQKLVKKKSYEYPYARRSSKMRENTADSLLKRELSDTTISSGTQAVVLPNVVSSSASSSPVIPRDDIVASASPPPLFKPRKLPPQEQPLIVQPAQVQVQQQPAPPPPSKIPVKIKQTPRPERKPVKVDRIANLQRFYEDELLSRKPIRFNSFDIYHDSITNGSKQRTGELTTVATGPPLFSRLYSFDSTTDSLDMKLMEESPVPPPPPVVAGGGFLSKTSKKKNDNLKKPSSHVVPIKANPYASVVVTPASFDLDESEWIAFFFLFLN